MLYNMKSAFLCISIRDDHYIKGPQVSTDLGERLNLDVMADQ